MKNFNYIKTDKIEPIARTKSASYGKRPIDPSNGLVRVLSIPANQQVTAHSHKTAGHEYFYIVKGKGTIFADDEQVQAEPGMILSVPTQVKHGWKNVFEEMLIISILMPALAYREAATITTWNSA